MASQNFIKGSIDEFEEKLHGFKGNQIEIEKSKQEHVSELLDVIRQKARHVSTSEQYEKKPFAQNMSDTEILQQIEMRYWELKKTNFMENFKELKECREYFLSELGDNNINALKLFNEESEIRDGVENEITCILDIAIYKQWREDELERKAKDT